MLRSQQLPHQRGHGPCCPSELCVGFRAHHACCAVANAPRVPGIDAAKHEARHQPALHKGCVIKTNSNQRYATNGVTGFIVRSIAGARGLPIQEFVVRNDCGCGSTIGPILSKGTGIRTVDVGQPQLSMHSCREMCSAYDVQHTFRLFHAFYELFDIVDASLAVDGFALGDKQ